MTMKPIQMPWLRDFYAYPIPAKLSREEFAQKYFPKYCKEYRPPTGIRAYVNKAGKYCVPQTTPGSIQSQLTKRKNRIDEAFALYSAQWDSQAAMDAKAKE